MEINLFGVGSIELDKVPLRTICKAIGLAVAAYLALLMLGINLPFPYATSTSVLCEGQCSLEDLSYHHGFKLDYESKVDEFEDKVTDTFKLELKFTIERSEFRKFGPTPSFRYSLEGAGYDSNSGGGNRLFEDKVNYDVDFISCENERNECKNVFLAEKYYFNSPYFKLDLTADTIPYSSLKAFSKIEILLTQRDYSYIKAVMILKLVLVFSSITGLLLFLRKLKQFRLSDIGIIQGKVIYLIIFLILFNEPLYYFNAYIPYKILNYVNTFIQATFLAMILHFWSYVLDTLTEQQMIREDPIWFSLPKILITFVIWIFMLVTFALVRFQELRDPSFFWKYESSDLMIKYLSWILTLLIAIYFVYIFSIVSKATAAIRRMNDNKKLVTGFTIAVVAAGTFLFMFFGIHTYVSMSSSILKIASIQGLLNLYIYLAAYFYSPGFLGSSVLPHSTKNDDRQIINDLYENELPEMPPMSHDPQNPKTPKPQNPKTPIQFLIIEF